MGLKDIVGNVGRKIIAAGFAAYISLVGLDYSRAATNLKSTTGSVEVLVGDESSTLDAQINSELDHGFGVFVRNTTTVDYEQEVSAFTFVNLSYRLIDGLSAAVQTQFILNEGAVPRLGVQYFNKFGEFSLFTAGSVGIKEKVDGEFVIRLKYQPKLSSQVRLLMQLESITQVWDEGHKFSVERGRVGISIDKYSFGLGGDLIEIGNKPELGYNIGGFFRIDV